MDCPSEENLIKMKLSDLKAIHKLDFDIPNRMLTIYHDSDDNLILDTLSDLNLGTSLKDSITVDNVDLSEEKNQRKLLWYVLLINFAFFIIEVLTGWISHSMGLIADSLDMLADSFVYGLSLLAIGTSVVYKKKVAKIAGYIQIILAILGFIEVIRRFVNHEQLPDFKVMIFISILALIANSWCLYLLQQTKSKEAHMQASMIFSSNDVIINIGVIIAGILVYVFKNGLPDLIIGSIVFVLVLQGAYRILKIAK
jgi:cation diffusion facilitator family transporter